MDSLLIACEYVFVFRVFLKLGQHLDKWQILNLSLDVIHCVALVLQIVLNPLCLLPDVRG